MKEGERDSGMEERREGRTLGKENGVNGTEVWVYVWGPDLVGWRRGREACARTPDLLGWV